jgi:hypothetical protein
MRGGPVSDDRSVVVRHSVANETKLFFNVYVVLFLAIWIETFDEVYAVTSSSQEIV